MKNILLLFLLVSIFKMGGAQTDAVSTKPEIRQFWMVFLKTGPADKTITDSVARARIFTGHFANMDRLHKEGILKLAGPFGENDRTWRGLFVFDCTTKEEAIQYANTDPGVAAGVFIYDIVPWYAQAVGSLAPGKPKQ